MAFYALEKLINMHDGYKQAFTVAGRNLLLVQENGKVYLISNSCPHMGAALHTGTLTPAGQIRCRSHGIEFDLESGRAEGPLANMMEPLRKFEIAYDGPNLGVEL